MSLLAIFSIILADSPLRKYPSRVSLPVCAFLTAIPSPRRYMRRRNLNERSSVRRVALFFSTTVIVCVAIPITGEFRNGIIARVRRDDKASRKVFQEETLIPSLVKNSLEGPRDETVPYRD